ncbi:restriction endonuclease subunit S [Escherichia coli]|uniref:restriction endonuclease subunit S n=1 Tax=Escherichia coli TaxID=562 RepID=UPI000B7E2E09|nr:restriction endonuclease subunit S [Escherichia coli]MED6349724.1 restriction endonuclease subunit S [Escherichia coli O157]EEY5396755.1 restriction endonuclease subunit S [Escherichia coli]EFA4699642.1 restriction endonuclease subunit S [Escherichia coli]EFB1748198.1 restriction endonuclease subunit S [Escherichia coli]EFB3795477.1 restriction endonuclease subunit S [Escherichia coli]
MSELSYLEKLLDGVEVEWVTLGSMADIGTGSSNRQDESENGIYPFYVRSKNILKSDTFEFDEVAIVIPGEGGIGDIFHYVEGKYALHQRAYRIRITTNAVDTKFLYYFMSSSFKQYILTKSVGATAISIRKPMLEGFKVPIPSPDNPEKSLAIQSEIVRILDKFTAITAELTAELTMRKKQYNYYRDQLLSFKEGEVEWKTLGEIGNFTYGYAAKAMDSGDARFVRITDINKDGKLSKENPMYVELNEENEKYTLEKNDLLMARTGATFGKTMIFEEDYPAVYAGFLIKLNLNETIINAKYYWHFAQSDFFWEQANKLVSGGGQPQFNANALKQVRVPIPYPSHPQKSLDEQGRIVDILDKFDAIAASITEGLPREIELRQKQYEYYRDLLFSFPKPETVSN